MLGMPRVASSTVRTGHPGCKDLRSPDPSTIFLVFAADYRPIRKTIKYLIKFYNFENGPFKYFVLINFKNENARYQVLIPPDTAKYTNVIVEIRFRQII